MIHATVRIVANPGKKDEVLAIFRSIAARTRVSSGCISCRIYQDVQEDRAILLEDFWKSEGDMHRHLRSEEYRNVLLALEMAVEKPEIRFETITGTSGIETIETARMERRRHLA